ncbi:MAG: 1-acyl-sn-glycerol-3-phosphate acyltransferase [Verrucomicrobia bacterium]|nr:1-acyl-sn-glycerol-3-phosphate acyltransferase [Verrucomicrobiota bacterium]
MKLMTAIGEAARWCVRKSLRLYYSRIEVEGRERLPAGGAVLFVANHPNSLMDPALIGYTAQRPVHFFAKAPLFDVPVFGALMHALGMVPAYRGQDDKASVRKNLETLDVGAQYLGLGEAVGIFPEGKTHDREGLEQVRTGAARIAWPAVRSGAGVMIVPLRLNYSRKESFRSAIWVRVGEPLDAKAWLGARGEEERPAIRSLTEEIDRRLKQVVIHVNEERWQPLLPELEVLLPAQGDEVRDRIAALHQRKRFADAMNHWLATDLPRAEAVGAAIEKYRAQLASAGLTMNSPILSEGSGRATAHLLKATIGLLLGLGPAVAGAVHHLVPFAITRGIVKLVKHPGRATIAQNRLMIGLPLYGIWYALVWWLLASHTQVWLAWLWTGLMPLCGIAALHNAWRVRHTGRAWWQEIKMLARPKELRRLRTEQIALRRQLEHLREEYRSGTG